MEYRNLGGTDLRVSRICFGTFPVGGAWGAYDNNLAEESIRTAFRLGINFFDTAQAYGFGVAERLLASALKAEIRSRRSEVFLATKGGLRVEGGRRVRDSSPACLRQGLEESLANLATDYVDLYQVHWPDPRTPLEETAGAIGDFVREGKIRYFGVSNFDVAQMESLRSSRKVDTLQPPYSLFMREIEREILPYCQAHRIGVLTYGPLAHGLLAGGISADSAFPADDWRSRNPSFKGERLGRNIEVVRELRRLARRWQITLAQLAIAWVLANPAVDVAIVGARRPEQIADTAGGAVFQLSASQLQEVESVVALAVPVEEPTPESVSPSEGGT